MKHVLILTQPLNNNYGGLLQAYALQTVVKSFGFDVATNRIKLVEKNSIVRILLDYAKTILKKVVKTILRGRIYTHTIVLRDTNKFIDQYIQTEKISSISKRIIRNYDVFIVGSDQVFRKKMSHVTKYFLEDLKDYSDKIKIAYAASFGTDDLFEWTDYDIKTCKQLAPKFNAISVREDTGIRIMKEKFGVVAEHVLDPTMLLCKEDYLRIIEKEDQVTRKNVLMTYILDESDEKKKMVELVKNQLGLMPLKVMPEEKYNKKIKDIEKCIFPSVSKWISGFRDADFVITDSFHGTVFSILFQKPFISISNDMRGVTRMSSLLKIFNLQNRLVSTKNEISENVLSPIDYQQVNFVLDEWRIKSMSFLKTNLCL